MRTHRSLVLQEVWQPGLWCQGLEPRVRENSGLSLFLPRDVGGWPEAGGGAGQFGRVHFRPQDSICGGGAASTEDRKDIELPSFPVLWNKKKGLGCSSVSRVLA